MNKKNPPIIVFVPGTSLIPNKGNHTQKIPPITSVKESNVNSAAGIALEPIEYKINPRQTKVPCKENSELLKLDEKNTCPFNKIITVAKIKQNNPATATVVNLGVSFLHLKVTEKTEKPTEEVIPKINPTKPIVGGTVESHKKPKAKPKKIAINGLGGKNINIAITNPLAK